MRGPERPENAQEKACDDERKAYLPERQVNELELAHVPEVQERLIPRR